MIKEVEFINFRNFDGKYLFDYLDPTTINGLNLYAYCGNYSVNRWDPTGHNWYHWAIGATVIVVCAL